MTSPQRDASTVASRIDLPFSALISAATADARSSARSAARSRMRSRSWAGVRRHSAAPWTAAATAASQSAVPARGTVPTTRPSHGEVISSTAPEAAAAARRRRPCCALGNQWISGSGTGSPASRKSKSQPSLAWVMCCRYSAP